MSSLQSERFLRAIRHQPVDATPVWFMRQAGRYLPEYRALRAQAGSFLALCKTPELACTVTLQPLARFALDAAIVFSDILTIPDAMGLGLYFVEGEGPAFERPLRHAKDITALGIPDPESDLGYVLDTIRLVRRELNGKLPLIGFCGSPWTLASYMVEGRARQGFPAIQALMRGDPEVLHGLLATLARALSLYLMAQIQAGADVVMIFDSWGGLLSPTDYPVFSLHYVQMIIQHLQQVLGNDKKPVIFFAKGCSHSLHLIGKSGCDVIGLDETVNLGEVRQRLKGSVALQGNLDPKLLYQAPEVIEQAVAKILKDYGAGSGHIFNLGHGIPPDVAPDRIAHVIETVHTLSRSQHVQLQAI